MTGRPREPRRVPAHWVALGLGVLLAGCASSASGSGGEGGVGTRSSAAAPVAVECGLSVLGDGRQVVRYCGDGEARIALTDGPHSGGIQDVKGAECRQRGEFLTANFGTNYSDEAVAQGEYVGLLLGGVGGSGDAATGVKIAGLEVTVGGKRESLSDAKATASLKGGRLEGSLTGRTADGPLTIQFHCAVT